VEHDPESEETTTDPGPLPTNPLALIGYLLGAVVFLLVAGGRALRDLPRRMRALAGSFDAPVTCWACGTSAERDDVTCPACHVALPAPILSDRYVIPGCRYDAACSQCHTPYRVDDFRPGVEWKCPACKAPIPR